MFKYALENQIQSVSDYNIHKSGGIVKVNNHDERFKILQSEITKLTNGQRSAYDKAVRHLNGEYEEPLIMFISGEGGTGISRVIELIMEFTRLHFGTGRLWRWHQREQQHIMLKDSHGNR